MENDWDNLIILDACRFDMFRELNTIDGELTAATSKGSTTGEFLNKNFTDQKYQGTVYISANPHVQNHNIDTKFVDRMRLWETHWNNGLGTVHPSDVVDQSISMLERYANKRLIVHFIQPHYPFIGETGKEIDHGTMTGDGKIMDRREYDTIWSRLESGEISKDVVWDSYLENLELTLPYVKALVDTLDGKSIITSDHGNSLGRFNVYGHPGNHYLSELVKIPWLVADYNERRTITYSNITDEDGLSSSVNSRLNDLGYV